MQKIKRFNKLIFASVIALIFVITIFVSLPSKVYASEVKTASLSTYDSYSNNTISKTNNILDSANLYQGTTLGVSGLPVIESNNYSRVVTKEFISVIPNTTYSLTCYNSNMQLFEVNYYDKNKICLALNTINEKEYQFTIPENCYYIILLFRMKDNSYIHVNDVVLSVMFNLGSNYLAYEPYIPLENNKAYQEGYNQGLFDSASNILYKAFEGASVELMYKTNVVITDTISLNDNDMYLTINNMSNVHSLLYNDESSNKYSLVIHLNAAINNEIVVLLNNSILDTTLTLSNSIGVYQESFSRAESSLDTIIANSDGQYFDTITYSPLYPPDYINFKLNLDASQLTFQEGYDSGLESGLYEGYNNGFLDGCDRGYINGKKDGYDAGYVDGKEYGFENAGDLASMPKNFINAMFSTPINIFRSLLNWEFFGINLFGVLTSLLTIAVVVFLFRKFKK